MPKYFLLSVGSNPKIQKSDAAGQGYLTAILHLAPYTTSKVLNTCPSASPGCRAACLFTAGMAGIYKSINTARIRKTRLYAENRGEFMHQLESDLLKFQAQCANLGVKPAVRLNGTSDILWERAGIMERFPEIQFYDYTKIYGRFARPLPVNYHLTFSLTESNEKQAAELLARGFNVAAVFDTPKGKPLPAAFLGRPVLDGRLTDLRFLDAAGYIVGLSALGKAKRDESGFVRSACDAAGLKRAA